MTIGKFLKRGGRAKRRHNLGSVGDLKSPARHDRPRRREGGGPAGDVPSMSARSGFFGPPNASTWSRDLGSTRTVNVPAAPLAFSPWWGKGSE